MPNVIQHKRNSTAGLVPSTGSLNQGELAINIGDGKLYTKNSSNSVINLGVTSISGTLITPASGNFLNSLSVNGTGVSVSGHSHTTSNISDFNSSVSGLISVKGLVPGSNITLDNNNGIYTISSAGGGGGGGVSAVTRGSFLLTASSGTFNVPGGYTVGSLDVFLNGVKLSASGDYTASNGTSFSLTSSAPSGSVIEYLSLVPGSNIANATGSGILVFNSSPSFSGIPTVPTANSGTNTTQVASTAFVRTEISNLGIIPGSGLVGTSGLDLSTNRTLDVGAGDGITVSANAVAVDSSVVRTTSDQTISGIKTFAANLLNLGTNNFGIFNGTLGDFGWDNELIIGNYADSDVATNNKIFAGSGNVGIQKAYETGGGTVISRLKFDVGAGSSVANTTLATTLTDGNITISLPNVNGTVALLSNINTSQITGVLPINKGGTGQTSISNGQLLIGSGTNFAANTLTAISGIGITSGSGTISIGVTGIPSSSITNFNSSVSGLLPVTNIIAGNNITVSGNAGAFTINSTAAGGGGATISNSGLNRLLVSDGSTSGIVGQANLTFNGSLLNIVGSGSFSNNVIASGFVRSGGTSSQFLKADGSVDSAAYTTNLGTVTSVAALTLTTTGSDVSSSVSDSTTTPTITLSIPSSSSSNRGLLTSADWNTFNNKQPSGSYALTTGKLSQFASTTSSELFGVISDEVGSGLLVFNNSPSLTGVPLAPTAASGTNTNQIASTAFVQTAISGSVLSVSNLPQRARVVSNLYNWSNFR